MNCNCIPESNFICINCEQKEAFNSLPLNHKINITKFWDMKDVDLKDQNNYNQYLILLNYFKHHEIDPFDFDYNLIGA